MIFMIYNKKYTLLDKITNSADNLFMKKIFLSLFTLLFFLTPIFSQNLDNLYGIWEGKDRFVFIEPGENNETEIVILLKDFYGWYYDRVA